MLAEPTVLGVRGRSRANDGRADGLGPSPPASATPLGTGERIGISRRPRRARALAFSGIAGRPCRRSWPAGERGAGRADKRMAHGRPPIAAQASPGALAGLFSSTLMRAFRARD